MTDTPRRTVLFDLDGTLLDTAPDFVRILNELRREEGLPALPYDKIREVVSDGAAALIKAGFDLTCEAPAFEPLRQRLLEKYAEGLARETRPFEGMEGLLDWLESQRIPWGVVTNKPERYSVPLLRQLELESRCAILICPEQVTQRKPHPEPLLKACQILDCSPARSVYIGDHRRDIEAGRRAGMITVAACFGYLHPDDSPDTWEADCCAQSAGDIQPWLSQRLGIE